MILLIPFGLFKSGSMISIFKSSKFIYSFTCNLVSKLLFKFVQSLRNVSTVYSTWVEYIGIYSLITYAALSSLNVYLMLMVLSNSLLFHKKFRVSGRGFSFDLQPDFGSLGIDVGTSIQILLGLPIFIKAVSLRRKKKKLYYLGFLIHCFLAIAVTCAKYDQ